jgi:lipoprotein-releasing system permease protein
VITWIESNYSLFSALKLEKITMFIILSLIILVASFNIFSTLTVKVVEKIKDIGILKALGFNNRSILFIFSMQGLILGFIGVFFGSFLGISLCVLLKKYPFIKLPQQVYYLEYLPVAIEIKDITLIICVGLFLSLFFSVLASLKTTKYSICEALRYE